MRYEAIPEEAIHAVSGWLAERAVAPDDRPGRRVRRPADRRTSRRVARQLAVSLRQRLDSGNPEAAQMTVVEDVGSASCRGVEITGRFTTHPLIAEAATRAGLRAPQMRAYMQVRLMPLYATASYGGTRQVIWRPEAGVLPQCQHTRWPPPGYLEFDDHWTTHGYMPCDSSRQQCGLALFHDGDHGLWIAKARSW